MTTHAIVLPYDRPANHIPRRDLVLGMADSLALEVSIVEWDDPSAPALDLTGGIGGPTLTLFIWPASCWSRSWDYGAPGAGPSGCMTPGSPLWSGDGVVSDTRVGTFNITFPPGTMASWPPRCCWSMQLAWNHSDQAGMLAWGNLHIRWSGVRVVAPIAIITDDGTMINSSAILVA